ncbi:MAG: peptidoglycan-binding protein [Planctomycetota bacterium]|jgi:hypothetical protein|nr:peptidoglycan-binding protein [Planctomycetota bacterium]
MFTGKNLTLVIAVAAALTFGGCDQKRQERVAQAQKLDVITQRLDGIEANLVVMSERPAPAPVFYAPTPAPLTADQLLLRPDNNDAIVQITDFAPAGIEPKRRAEVARLGQPAPKGSTKKSSSKANSGGKKSGANYSKTIAVSGLNATDVQKALKNAGYNPGPVDGKIGAKTVAAIKNFQRVEGLSADGVVGRKTWERLSVHLNGASAASDSTAGKSDFVPASDFTF